ncbi:hypothetical protein DFP72DRAFT_480838 [Ephemerocybe angulata]|uniref:Uncharacterized protein n=1 Tax=Ephemerocybe angulata TaxID=980116 RepID=A0A8H6IGD8_9AGAR|nr:hypothetical protein DFP72DRAFT_480838 [Tulosesus angulatus]
MSHTPANFSSGSVIAPTTTMHQHQIGFKALLVSFSAALLGWLAILGSLCTRLYGVLATPWAFLQAGGSDKLKLWICKTRSGNRDISTFPLGQDDPSVAGLRLGTGRVSPLPLHRTTAQPVSVSRLGLARRLAMTFLRKMISLTHFGRKKNDSRDGSNHPKSFLDMSPPSCRSSSSTNSSGFSSFASSSTTLHVSESAYPIESDLPYGKSDSRTEYVLPAKPHLYTRRPSHAEDEDGQKVFVVPLHTAQPSLPSSSKSPAYFRDPFTAATAPRRATPRQSRRNPKLALTLNEFLHSRNENRAPNTIATTIEDDENTRYIHESPLSPRSQAPLPHTPNSRRLNCSQVDSRPSPPLSPHRYKATPPARREPYARMECPRRASSPTLTFEPLPVPPSWKRKQRARLAFEPEDLRQSESSPV